MNENRAITSVMSMRCAHLLALGGVLTFAAAARADKFGGFSGVDRPYLVNQDRVCTPLKVAGGAASGVPSCTKAATDAVAKLSIKDPIVQSGGKANFSATAAGRTLTVTRKPSDAPVVVWSALDPIGRVVEVYASQYNDRVAVAYTTRRAGSEVTDVVAFDLGASSSMNLPAQPETKPPGTTTDAPAPPTTTPAPPADPKLTAAVTAARKATGARALVAWKAVLAIDASHSEALYQTAAAQAAGKQTAAALATLGTLGASTRDDAIEWLIEARFAPPFAALRTDGKFRSAVGIGRPATALYERMMGLGGQWEQSATACDRAEVRLHALRDRTFKLRVKTVCQGSTSEMPFKGTWRIDGARVVLTFPNKGKAVSRDDESSCGFERTGDEDALKCHIGRDLEFTVLPTRR